jgi:Transposase IS4
MAAIPSTILHDMSLDTTENMSALSGTSPGLSLSTNSVANFEKNTTTATTTTEATEKGNATGSDATKNINNCSNSTTSNPESTNTKQNDALQSPSTIASPSAHQTNLPASPQAPAHVVHTDKALEDLQDNGYDSDGASGPNNDVLIEEGDQFIEEDPVGTIPVESTASGGDDVVDTAMMSFIDIPESKLIKLSVSDLKIELQKRGVRGIYNKSKPQLQHLLRHSLASKDLTIPANSTAKPKKKDDMSAFAINAYWQPLVPESAPVAEPENIANFRAPTVPEEEAEFVPVKYNFNEQFDRPPFIGMKIVPRLNRNRKISKTTNNRIVQWSVVADEGGPRLGWVEKHNLSVESQPQDWLEAFLPSYRSPQESGKFHTNAWSKFTNMKAQFSYAGTKDCYPEYNKPFSPREIEQHIAIYILNGLSPSPNVEMKFSSHEQDPIQGNNLIRRSFGPNGVRRHRHFKAFFCVQDPMKPVPSRKENPLHKVSSFLKWIQQVSQSAWVLGRDLAGDEQTIGFQGNHRDKRRITYKAEGDGFQCDAICDKGYTFNFFFRNMPAPKKYLQQGWSPLHARMLSLFDCFQEKNHRVWMDNLYLSAKFAKGCFTHPQQVLLAGVARKSGRGVPECVLQEEVKNKTEARKVRGTIKAAVLRGDHKCPDLVAVSVYDTKPVHFITMIAEELKWVECERSIYCVETGKVEPMKFLRLNVNSDYNFKMNDVDAADQLRNNYRFDHWMRKRKWWWSIFFWGLGIVIVNAYICYVEFNLTAGKKKKDLLSHYEFRKAIALAWLDPDTYWANRYNDTVLENKGTKRKLDDMSTSTKATTRSSSKNLKRPTAVTDKSLDPYVGLHACRLSRDPPHWPKPQQTKRTKCALHHWAADLEERPHVVMCSRCRVNLCVHCFETFHSVENIVGQKNKICNELLELKKKKDTKNDKKEA